MSSIVSTELDSSVMSKWYRETITPYCEQQAPCGQSPQTVFPFAAPQLPSIVSPPFAGVLDGVLDGVLNGKPGTETCVPDTTKDVVDDVVAPSEDKDDGDGDRVAGFGNDDGEDDDGALTADEMLRELEVAGKEELVVAVLKLKGLKSEEFAIEFMKLVGKIEIELLIPTIEGILRDEVADWDEEPELNIEGVTTLDGVLIAFEVLDEDKPVVDVTEVEVLETDELTIVLMELVAEVEIELPLLAIGGGMEDKIVDWEEGVEPGAPVLWADTTFVDKDRPLLERTDAEAVKGAS